MFKLDHLSIELECPLCHFYNPVTIKQVRLRDAVICRGCKATIRLEDHLNETRKAVRSVRRAMAEFEEQLKRLGTIKIRL